MMGRRLKKCFLICILGLSLAGCASAIKASSDIEVESPVIGECVPKEYGSGNQSLREENQIKNADKHELCLQILELESLDRELTDEEKTLLEELKERFAELQGECNKGKGQRKYKNRRK